MRWKRQRWYAVEGPNRPVRATGERGFMLEELWPDYCEAGGHSVVEFSYELRGQEVRGAKVRVIRRGKA